MNVSAKQLLGQSAYLLADAGQHWARMDPAPVYLRRTESTPTWLPVTN